MRIDLIRHGACLDHAFLRGQSPSKLSTLGKQQMQEVFLDVESVSSPERVITSPANRCLEAATEFYLKREKNAKIQVESGFQERHFGVWDGLSYDDVKLLDINGLQAYLENPFEYFIEQSESLKCFENRTLSAFEQCLKQATSASLNHVLIVTHGGVIRVLLKHILGLNNEAMFQLEVGFAARIRLDSFLLDPISCDVVHNPCFPKGYFIKLVELAQSPLKT